MSDTARQWIVETDWLAQHLDAPDVLVFDSSWHLPNSGRNGREEYMSEHLPDAQFIDINELSDEASDLPHMLPSTVKFASHMKMLGVGDGTRVVVYDADGIFAAARVWWMLRVMGHVDVAVLNGGLRKWKGEGFEVSSEVPGPRSSSHFTPRVNAGLVADISDMRSLISNPHPQKVVVDARPVDRFEGQTPEPRPGLKLGHMPGAMNVPYGGVLNDDGTLKTRDALVKVFADAGVDLNARMTATCGSGVTASVVALALATLGREDVAVYDGSWAEWGCETADHPVATGPA